MSARNENTGVVSPSSFGFLAALRDKLKVRGSEELAQWAKLFEQFD